MSFRVFAYITLGLVFFAGPGCQAPRMIEIDGRFDDWAARSDGRGLQAVDPHELWFCFELPEEVTLQGLNRPAEVHLLIDVDHRAGTGKRWEGEKHRLGVDARVVFSPLLEGKPGNGLAVDIFPAKQMFAVEARPEEQVEDQSTLVRVVRDNGQGTDGVHISANAADGISVDTANETAVEAGGLRVGHADVGLVFAPTFASDRFEVRLNRHLLSETLAMHGGAVPGRRMRAVLVFQQPGRAPVVWNEFSFRFMPRMRAIEPAGGPIAPTSSSALRFMVHNVKNSGPRETPGPFARFWRALAPDVVLIQEWYDAEPAELTAWATEHVDSSVSWHAVTGPGGVAVVSRHPLTQLLPDPLWVPEHLQGGWARENVPVRFVAARVQTPHGTLVTASVHLTCCGFAGSPEDVRRIGEATVIAGALEALDEGDRRTMIIGGDVNLVGSERPLRLMVDGHGIDALEMAVVPTPVRGSRLWYTWIDTASQFSPGRLDWMWYTDSSARLIKSLALDTDHLSEAALKQMGLMREDSRSSDHMIMLGDFVLDR